MCNYIFLLAAMIPGSNIVYIASNRGMDSDIYEFDIKLGIFDMTPVVTLNDSFSYFGFIIGHERLFIIGGRVPTQPLSSVQISNGM